MTRADIERYRRRQLGIRTDGDRDRMTDRDLRFRPENIDQKLIEPTSYLSPPFVPPSFQAPDTATVSAPLSGDANGIYVGQAPTDISLVTVRMLVTTAGSTITWAELAICTAIDFPMGNVDLSLNGFTGVAGTFNSTGTKDTEISVNLARGAHVWLVWGSQASTPFAVRGGMGDPLATGRYLVSSATRPSTMSDPTTFTASTSGARAAWIAVQW